MTQQRNRGTIDEVHAVTMDSDGAVSVWYLKGERKRRRILFRIKDGRVLVQNPATKVEHVVGMASKLGDQLVILLFL